VGDHPPTQPAGSVLKLGLSVPLYNEEDCVTDVVEGLLEALAGVPHELVLVNNGSQDTTGQKINALAVKHSAVRAIHLEVNAGYGGGILAGMNSLTTPIVGWTWGDGQVRPEIVREAWSVLIKERRDLVKTCRYERHDGTQRFVVSKLYNRVMRHGFGLPWSDVNGCPKLMTAKTYAALQLRSLDWFLDPECLLKAQELGLSIGEVDAVMHPREGGVSKVHRDTLLQFIQRLWAWRGGWRP